jgi:Domain of unknown function (DUF1929)
MTSETSNRDEQLGARVSVASAWLTTHSLDTEQRLVELRFHRHDGCRFTVEAPTEATLAPPGWYMLFIVDHHGVPSFAKWVHLTRT